MRILPNSRVKLYSNIKISEGVNIAFSTKEKQEAYFNRHLVRTFNNVNVVDTQSNYIDLQIDLATAMTVNFLSFNNISHENHEYYCSIDGEPQYISNETTRFYYSINSWQSHRDDITFDNSFISREHLSQADKAKEDVNPYQPSLVNYLQTSEELSTAQDLEKEYAINDTITQSAFCDGFYLANTPSNVNFIVAQISPIDFADLDSDVEPGGRLPSEQWESLLNSCDYYIKANESYARHGSDSYRVHSSFVRPCNVLFIESYSTAFSDLLKYMAAWGTLSSVISVKLVPSTFLEACFDYDKDNKVKTAKIWSSLKHRQTYHQGASGVWDDDVPYLPRNKKLLLYPYTSLRVYGTNGETTDFCFEKFSNLQRNWPSGTTTGFNQNEFVYLQMIADVSTEASLTIVPVGYKTTGASKNGGFDPGVKNYNSFRYKMTLDDFPEMPYSTDGYLAFLGSQANAITAQNDLDFQRDLEVSSVNSKFNIIGAISNAVGGIVPGTAEGDDGKKVISGGMGNPVSTATNIVSGAYNAYASSVSADAARARIEESRTLRGGTAAGYDRLISGAQEFGRYNDTRPAHAQDYFVSGSKGGGLNYLQSAFPGAPNPYIVQVQLKREILKKYDDYFDRFGYNSSVCHVPYICQFSKGAVETDKVPAWVSSDEGSYCYTKTADLICYGANAQARASIKAMFDAGVKMWNGDTLQ